MIEWLKGLFKKDTQVDLDSILESDFIIIKENHLADMKYRALCKKIKEAKMELIIGMKNYDYKRFRFEDLSIESIDKSLEKEVNRYFQTKYKDLADEETDSFIINDLQMIESKSKGLDVRLSRTKFCLALKLFDGRRKYFSFDEEGLEEIDQLIDREMGGFE